MAEMPSQTANNPPDEPDLLEKVLVFLVAIIFGYCGFTPLFRWRERGLVLL